MARAPAQTPEGGQSVLDTLSQRVDALQQGLNQRVDALQRDIKDAATKSTETAKEFANLEKSVALLQQRLEAMDHLKQQPLALAELRGEFKNEINLLKKALDDFSKWQEELKQRDRDFRSKAWTLVPPVLAAILSSVLTGLIGYFVLKPQ